MAEILDRIGRLDLAAHVRPGDTVVWGQACAEPLTLTERLMEQRAAIGGFRCFVGAPASGTVRPEHADHVSFLSYCGSGGNRAMHRAGVLDILPVHYSTLPDLIESRILPVDVALVQLSPADAAGRHSLGLADEYLSAAIDRARVVIAEVNDQVPWTRGTRTLTAADLDVIVHTSRPPAEILRNEPGAVEERVADHVADLVDDGATLQLGLGALPEAIVARLADRRDLGVHSGLIGDTVADLMEAGVITGARKTVDRGRTVTGALMGSSRLFRYAHRNPAIELRDTRHTHDPGVLAAQERFVAINSAIEVDLSGQINAEVARGSYVGAVGGAIDFLRGAARSWGGLPIVALTSTARSGTARPGTARSGTAESGAGNTVSRIVAKLSGPVSTPRADAGIIVTEYGVADLRGRSLDERRARMLAIAHPDHRPALEKECHL